MFHCGGSQDARWMGGLGLVIPLWWIMYVCGALGLGGLPYWSGYYCKSALWNYSSGFNSYWGGVQLAIILGTFCTYIYLCRLGLLIFSGSRGGHRAIYRIRWPGLATVITFGLLSILVAWGGALWVNYIVYYWQLAGAGIYYYGSVSLELINIISTWGWFGLLIAYSSFFLLIGFLINLTAGRPLSRQWFLLFLVYLLVFIIWTV
jgi:NADH:ubiquinone oxidoreductase subunit 5 (subunit L)/multisubunit Na+/H+ antiporter MnhA subunit